MRVFKKISEEEAKNLTLAEHIDRLKLIPIPENIEITFIFTHENMDLRYPIYITIDKTLENKENTMLIYHYIYGKMVEYDPLFYQLEWENWEIDGGYANLEKGKKL